jgi:ABC-type Fe3+ transport system substrate-binding protein
MKNKRLFIISGLLILGFALLPFTLVCAQPAPAPLAQVIEGAKKEGTVSVHLAPSLKQEAIRRLEKEIQGKYGVDLKINFTPMGIMPQDIAKTVMEHKAGAPPSFDLMTIAQDEMFPYMQAGAGQKIDWEPLAKEADVPGGAIMGMPPELEIFRGYGLVYYTAHRGLMYNPKAVQPNEVPKKFSDLGNPKWEGQIGMRGVTANFMRLSYYLGADYVLNTLQAIMKNGVILDTMPNLANRFKLEEISMAYMVSEFLGNVRRSKPAEWQSLEVSLASYFYTTLPTGALHPNAAKLVALYLAGPDGYKFMKETAGAGNILYKGNTEYDINQQDKAQGLRLDGAFTDEKLLKFMTSSAEGQELRKKIEAIFR